MEEIYFTDRLILYTLSSTHAPEVLRFYRDNAAYFDPYELTRPNNFYTLEAQALLLDYANELHKKGESLRLYISLKEEPQIIIGCVALNQIESPVQASLGYKLDYRFQHYGYGLEACQFLVQHAFTHYKLQQLVAQIQPDNLPSIKLINRLGFIYKEHQLAALHINGILQDIDLYYLTASKQSHR